MLQKVYRYSLFVFLILLSRNFFAGVNHDSLFIEKRIDEGTQKLLTQKKKNDFYVQSGEFDKLNFIVNLNDRITDTIVNGGNHYLTDNQLEQKLNDSLKNIYLNYQLETYLILANYHQIKINARLSDSTSTVDLKDLFSNTSKWYSENSDVNSIKDNSYNISLGISNRIQQATNSNFILVGLSVWKIQYLENKEGRFHSYSVYPNIQNASDVNISNLGQYYNNIQSSFKNSPDLNRVNSRDDYAKIVTSVLNRAARNVSLRLQILQATNTTQLESIYTNFNSTDYFALNDKERLHSLRVFIKNTYPEEVANKIIGLVPKDAINTFYDSLLVGVSKAAATKKYLKWIIENTSGDDLDNLFAYFVRNFNYYYMNKVSSYSNENDYDIINLTETPIDIGDAVINKADITATFEVDLDYQVITDLNVDIFPRQTNDNTQVNTGLNNGSASLSEFEIDDYLFQSSNYIETINPTYETVAGIIHPFKPISVSYTGEDEDINSSMGSKSSALVPAFYLYYIKNEQNKEKVKNYIVDGATITLEVIAIVGSDGMALPLIQATKYGNTALKVYKAANYLSLGLTGAVALTNSPELEALKSKLDVALTIVNLPAAVKTLPSAWKSVKTIAKNTASKTSNIITSAKLDDLVLTLKAAKSNLVNLPQSTRKQVMKLYYYLKKRGAKLSGLVNGVNYYKGIPLKQGVTSQWVVNNVLNKAKGLRPPVADYIDATYETNHLNRIIQEGGAFIFTPEDIVNPLYKSFNPQKFVMLKSDMKKIIDQYKVNNSTDFLEDALGYQRGALKNKQIYVLEVSNPQIKMPTGNEGGANLLWEPGGLTSGGMREAVLDNQAIIHNNSLSNLPNAKLILDF